MLGLFAAIFFIGNFIGKSAFGRFVDRFGNTNIFILSEVLMALFILLPANYAMLFIIIICSIILGIFTKSTVSALQTMVSDSSEHHGNFVSAFVTSTATTLAPLLLGLISDKLSIMAAFNVMAIMALVAIIPIFTLHGCRKVPQL